MAKIERRNVIELIGNNTKRYHSCIITCFTFDFTYFEERIAPVLRAVNIRNINIFVDGNELIKAQEFLSGKEFSFQKNYNLIGVHSAHGVFHPKIIYLFGQDEGLLTIGSGNITSSGLSYNDEVWSSFHHRNLESSYLHLFRAAWLYINQFFQYALGVAKVKLDWIPTNTPWLEELVKSPSFEVNDIQFVSESSLAFLINELRSKKIEKMVVISPYYDKSGKTIELLQQHLQPQKVDVIVDQHSTLLPTDIFESDHCHFHFWADVVESYDEEINRLHAKIFYFSTEESEYMLMGSANATYAAMGDLTNVNSNTEAGLFLTRPKQTTNWLKELGIQIPKKGIATSELAEISKINRPVNHKIIYEYQILYAENTNENISLYLDKIINQEVSFQIEDRDGTICSVQTIKYYENRIELFLDHTSEAFKICICQEGKRVSNYAVIHQVEQLLKTNPNQINADLDILLGKDNLQNFDWYHIIKFVDLSWVDDENEVANKGKSTAFDKRETPILETTSYENLSYEDFNTNAVYHKLSNSSNPNIRITDFFITLSKGLDITHYEESEEIRLEIEGEADKGKSDKVATNEVNISCTVGRKIKKEVSNFLVKLYEFLDNKIDNAFPENPKEPLKLDQLPSETYTITNLSKVIIALELLGKYLDSFYEEENGSKIKFVKNGPIEEVDTAIGFVTNTIGLFYIAFNKGTYKYDYEFHNKKLKNYKIHFVNLLFSFVDKINWRKNEIYAKLLRLNTIRFSELTALELSEIRKMNQEEINNYFQWKEHFDDLEKRREHLIRDVNQNLIGKIIFNSKLGFCYVSHVNNNYELDLHTLIGNIKIKLIKCVVFNSL
ncbi:phospholipase D-like domain-containing protein [Empedobacter falsenii]